MVLNIRKPAVFNNNFPDSVIHPIIIPQISLDETKLLTPTGPFCFETGSIFFPGDSHVRMAHFPNS